MIFKQIDTKDFKLVDFYKENPSNMLFNPLESIQTAGRQSYVVLDFSGNIVAAMSVSYANDHLCKLHSSLVHRDHRGKGIGKFINQEMENKLRKQGYGKVVGYVYVENLPNIILKLKMGYIIEGTLRDHDYPGQHEYVISKML